MGDPLKVLITGAAGQIAYSLIYNVARGNMLGPEQPVKLVLLDIPMMQSQLDGLVMELEDCTLPLLKEVISLVTPEDAFKGVDIALLVGAMPRREGMERKDLLKANVKIFKEQGEFIELYANKSIKIVVVGNPANTNALICAKYAKSIPRKNFTALTRLDQNRAQAQIAKKINKGVSSQDVKDVVIWGNHSSTQFPDYTYATVTVQNETFPVSKYIKDDSWLKNEFITTVQQRGGAVIKARKLSSAMSAASAIVEHVRDWCCPGPDKERILSMGVVSDGSYDIPEGLVYSLPVRITGKGTYEIVQGLEINDFQREKMDISKRELIEERDTALDFCENK